MTRTPRRALLIDDNEADNFYHERLLRKSGHGIAARAFTSASEALHSLREAPRPPDFIFLDLNMPRMDGWRFLEEYSLIAGPHFESKIVMITNSANPRDRERVASATIPHVFVTKPLTASLLAEILSEGPRPTVRILGATSS